MCYGKIDIYAQDIEQVLGGGIYSYIRYVFFLLFFTKLLSHVPTSSKHYSPSQLNLTSSRPFITTLTYIQTLLYPISFPVCTMYERCSNKSPFGNPRDYVRKHKVHSLGVGPILNRIGRVYVAFYREEEGFHFYLFIYSTCISKLFGFGTWKPTNFAVHNCEPTETMANTNAN